MTHPPQEVLLKVMCSECGGSGNGTYFDQYAHMDLPTGEPCKFCTNGLVFSKEPATRVVLTVEEYTELESERLAFKDFVQWMFDHKYSQVENVDIPSETIRFIHNRLGYANP